MRLHATVIDAWYWDSSTTYTTLNFLRPFTFSGVTRRSSGFELLRNVGMAVSTSSGALTAVSKALCATLRRGANKTAQATRLQL